MEPEDRREHIFELAEKFKFLKESAISRGHCRHAANESSFCDKLGIPRTTLMGSVKAGGLTSEQQRLLAEKCKFSLSWPEWNDPRADRHTKRESRQDTCDTFKARYLEHHSQPKSGPPPVLSVRLKEDWSAETERFQSQLASLALRFGQAEPLPAEVMLTFDLNCPEVVADACLTGVKQGILTFHCGRGYTTKASARTGFPDGVEFNGAKFTPLSMDKKEPSWLVTATDAEIGLVGNAAETFIRIMNLTPGASVKADFTARLWEIETTFVMPEEQDKSAAKRKIKKRLRQMQLSRGENGIVMLAVAEIKFAAWDE